MDIRRGETKFKESNSLLKIKQKAIILRDIIEKIQDGTKTWQEILELYSLSASILQDLQSDLSDIPEQWMLVPDNELHEEPNYVPDRICPNLNENIENEANDYSKEFQNSFFLNDLESQANKFNAFCHELRSMFKK